MAWNLFSGTQNLLIFNKEIMKNYIILLFTASVLLGCSSPKHVTTPQNLKYKVNGFYAKVDVNGSNKDVSGEIIEVSKNEIKLLQEGTLQSLQKDIVKSCVISVSLTVNNPKKINTWASLVNVASLGHGVFGIITLPVNIGTTAGITKSKYALKYPDNISWDELYKFARFPQGIPNNIDAKTIR